MKEMDAVDVLVTTTKTYATFSKLIIIISRYARYTCKKKIIINTPAKFNYFFYYIRLKSFLMFSFSPIIENWWNFNVFIIINLNNNYY